MNILVVDDHQLFIDGLHLLLKELCDSVEVTQATRADQAIILLESGTAYDLVLVDLAMPDMGGLSIIQRMHERGIWLPLVVVSAEENIRTIKAALDLGALGFIPKSFSGAQMLAALQTILAGNTSVPLAIAQQVRAVKVRRTERAGNLTKRQQQVLDLLAQGHGNRQIAETLYLTEHTVKAHVGALFIELNAKNRTDCVQIAKQQGLIQT